PVAPSCARLHSFRPRTRTRGTSAAISTSLPSLARPTIGSSRAACARDRGARPIVSWREGDRHPTNGQQDGGGGSITQFRVARLIDVLAHHDGTIVIEHRLRP